MCRSVFRWVAVVGVMSGCAPPPDVEDGSGDLDASRLDREEDGYPGAGARGYGTEVGERLANSDGLQLRDCNGELRDFKQFFDVRDDGTHNRGVLVNIGAGWCGPCQEETLEFVDVYADYHEQGIELVQVLFQDWASQAPTEQFCEEWRTGQWEGDSVDLDLAFPVFIDPINDWTSIYLQDPASATPINLLVDANANIRFKSEGIKLRPDDLRTQLDLVIGAPYDVPE
jgi:thiol-disulfide isomerase/thioredoxin